jgi:uncharacterized protein (DUF2141 family)
MHWKNSSCMTLFLFVTLACAAPVTGQQSSSDNVIHVQISGFRNDKGVVRCALFASENGFPKDPSRAVALEKAPITNGSAVCEFSGVAPGRYAVSVFHDENGNGKLDTNFIGIPKEGVGASNDAKGHMGPPKFDAAAFQHSGGRLELKIHIFYL